MMAVVSPLALLLPGLLLATPLGMVVAAAGGVAVASAPSATRAALELQQSTPEGDRKQLDQPFSDAARSDWHYVPRSRVGIAWRDMSAKQREATTQLLRSALSDAGMDKVHAVMGGFHLFPADEPYLKRVIAELQGMSPDAIIPLHCSGPEMVQLARAVAPDKLLTSTTGTEFVFGA